MRGPKVADPTAPCHGPPQVELFGSNATGLSLCSSDFDLVLRQSGLQRLVPTAALQRLSRRGRSTGVAQKHKAEVIRSAKVRIFNDPNPNPNLARLTPTLTLTLTLTLTPNPTANQGAHLQVHRGAERTAL